VSFWGSLQAGSSAGQEIPRIVWNLKVYYRFHKRPPLVSILSQITPVHVHASCCIRAIFNIILPSTSSFSKCSFTFVFPTQYIIHSIFQSFVSVFITCISPYLLFRWLINNEMGRACGTYGRQERCVLRFGGEIWRKTLLGKCRHSWEDNIKVNL